MNIIRYLCLFALLAALMGGCVSQQVTSAEEYFSLGMAYFELGQASKDAAKRVQYFTEAEKWLNRAKAIDKTQNASEYNLGRLAFETGKYQDAVKYFQRVLKRDGENVLALRAISYTLIKTGEIEKALSYYHTLQELVPESADDGYNYALVLYAMKKYEEAENVLAGYRFALLDNSETLLLYARCQKEQNKVEALDSYSRWLTNNTSAKVRFEYAQILESHEFYARALEEYRSTLSDLTATSVDPKKSDLRFAIAKLLLIADNESDEGIKEMETAVTEGFNNVEELEKLLEDARISDANKNSLKKIISDKKKANEKTPAVDDKKNVPEIRASLEEDLEGSSESSDE